MRIAVTGSTGLIGSALVRRLAGAGHSVVRLVRRPARTDDEVTWNPEQGSIDTAGLAGVEAAVHLAGAGVGDHRWSETYKRTIRNSRVLGTRTLVTALSSLDPLPRTLISGSAVGFYGDRGDEVLREDSPGGDGFLADVVRAWEAETLPAEAAGIRVARIRTGLVMAPRGGAFGQLMLLTRFGLGGPLGSGRQWWPWITLDDEVSAIEFLLDGSLAGTVNLCSPNPERNRDIARALGRALHRPALIPAPQFALRIVLGEFAGEVTASERTIPQRLLDEGFTFRHPTLPEAADWLLGAA